MPDIIGYSAPIIIHEDEKERELFFDSAPIDRLIRQIDFVFSGALSIGLIVPTSFNGICWWKAILLSGRKPVLLQYPTAKLSRVYWRTEVAAAVAAMSIDGIIHHGVIANPDLPVPRLDIASAEDLGAAASTFGFFEGRAIQLSSGTTGFRKGVSLAMADVGRHVADYNTILRLGSSDCVVSWLPLYHDMGFVACFLMPILTGARLVLVDPMTWVRRPQLLYELIERHRGTICFMPNFGFQVMAARARASSFDLSSMRRWISCSEPTRLETMTRFSEVSGTDWSKLSNCYAMAENIFAVTQSDELRTQRVGRKELISCGASIPSTAIKIVDEEVYVRSPYSLKNYEGSDPIIDADGYYPTGDLGEIIGGELYLYGRKQDVLLHAGRKFMMSDLDHQIGELVAESAGRICVFDQFNEAIGTDEPVCLIEHERFWAKSKDGTLIAAIRDRLGLEMTKVEFVPPGFLTKTSSGKMSRSRTRENYVKLEQSRRASRIRTSIGMPELRTKILAAFPGLQPNVAFSEQLDSLGLINLSLLFEEAGVESLPELTLDTLPPEPQKAASGDLDLGPVLKVVCWVDHLRVPAWAIQGALATLSRRFGINVHCSFVAVPCAAAVLSDLIFEDYFLSRADRFEVYEPVTNSLALFRDADIVIVDDIMQLLYPLLKGERQSYPKISHRFEPATLSQFLAVRWGRYSQNHHLVPSEIIEGESLTPDDVNGSLDDLEDYLKLPIVRMALAPAHAEHTLHWQVRCYDHRLDDFPTDLARFQKVDGNALSERELYTLLPRLNRR